jgi:uncharacterized protein YecA (UPF0149 family)
MSKDFSTIQHGTLPTGTVTEHGTITQVSLTAYQMDESRWVPFMTVHGPYQPVERLVFLASDF